MLFFLLLYYIILCIIIIIIFITISAATHTEKMQLIQEWHKTHRKHTKQMTITCEMSCVELCTGMPAQSP